MTYNGGSSQWMAYTPTMTGFTPGNGVVSGRYDRRGSTVTAVIVFTVGSSTSMASGSFGLPFPAASSGALGQAQFVDQGSNFYDAIGHVSGSTIQIYARTSNGAYTQVTPSVPFTWVATDAVVCQTTYEVAQ